MNLPGGLNPQNVIENLKELKSLTGDAAGAQRLAWTDTWQKARQWLEGKLAALLVEFEIDEAGNSWATLKGASAGALVIGSHIDSVANGGWLDGCLGVSGALEILCCLATQSAPPVTERLVSWADEEGARFGRSLLGSGAATGFFDPGELRDFALNVVQSILKFGKTLDFTYINMVNFSC
jgi:hypothetical protein